MCLRNRRHFHHIEQAAHRVGLTAAETGWIEHSDKITHMMYNALFCSYHMHPHDPLCANGELEHDIFDALVVDYSPSSLTITWLDTYPLMTLRRGGFADNELGGRLIRDREYWAKMAERITALMRFIGEYRREDEEQRNMTPQVGLNQLIFLGEFGADGLLRRFLREALRGTRFDFDIVTIHVQYDPVFASSIGAAVIEKAIMDAAVPCNCQETIECKDMRERIYEEALRTDSGSEL